MVTAEEAFEAKKLEAKYGVVGRAAARYRMAGYEVKVESADLESSVNFIAWKRREKLVVKVYQKSGEVPSRVVEEIAAKAREIGGRPVLVLYGRGPRVTSDLLELAKSNNVSIKRMRV